MALADNARPMPSHPASRSPLVHPGSARSFLTGGVLVVVILATAAGCKRTGTGSGAGAFPLVPVSQGRESLVGTLTWPSVEGSLSDVAAVARKLGLPFSAEDAKATLLAKAPYPETM